MTEPTVEERLREWTEHNDPMLSYHPLMCDALAKLREQAEEIERLTLMDDEVLAIEQAMGLLGGDFAGLGEPEQTIDLLGKILKRLAND